MSWIKCGDELPPIDTPVFGGHFSNGVFHYWMYMRSIVDDGVWLWSRLNADTLHGDYECDDDYQVDFWQPLLTPPQLMD